MRMRSSITAGVLTGLAVARTNANGSEGWAAEIPLALALLLLFAIAWNAVRGRGSNL